MSERQKVPSSNTDADEFGAHSRYLRWTLLGVMLVMLLAMLDNTIVGTSLPTIVSDLDGAEHLSWVVTAYILATAATTPIWGKCGDLFGRKHVFLISIVIFLIGSVLSGLSQSMLELILFRIIQGAGAGGIGGGAFALIATLVSPRERGRYQGMTAIVMVIGTVGGPLVGGVITGTAGWRWAFFINLPLGILALVWCAVMLQLPRIHTKAVIDWLGIGLMTSTICALVLAATWAGSTYPWGSWQIIALLLGAIAGLTAFIQSQRRAPEPLLPLRIFAERNFRLASIIIFASGAAAFGSTLYLPLFQQTVQGASAINSGLLLLPLMLPVAIVSNIAGKIMSKTGRYKIFPILGGVFLTAGMALLATMDATTSRSLASIYMVIAGSGLGLLTQMSTTIAQNSVDMRDMGAASSTVNLFRTIGGSIGVAIFGSLLTSAVAGQSVDNAGITVGIQHIFTVAAGVSAAALTAALFIREVPLRQPPTAPQCPAATANSPATALPQQPA